MGVVKIDMQKLRDALPKRALLKLGGKKGAHPAIVTYLEVTIAEPFLDDEDFEMAKDWHKSIVGESNIEELLIEKRGQHWTTMLKHQKYEFPNMTDEDKETYKTK